MKTTVPYKTSVLLDNKKLAKGNVRGAATPTNKAEIDVQLENIGIHITCLQETNMNTRAYASKHSNWYLSKQNKRRGLAILIMKYTDQQQVKSFHDAVNNHRKRFKTSRKAN